MTKKTIDPEMEAIAAELVARGWKKNGYQYYKYMDKGKKFLTSVQLARKGYGIMGGNLGAVISFHNVDLNEFANFIRQYNKVEPPDIGLFQGFKIPLSLQLRGWDSLPLVAANKLLIYDKEDPAAFAEACSTEAEAIYRKYSDIDELVKAYESEERRRRDTDSLVINLYLKRYQDVRELYERHFGPEYDGTTGYLLRYMDRYDLR